MKNNKNSFIKIITLLSTLYSSNILAQDITEVSYRRNETKKATGTCIYDTITKYDGNNFDNEFVIVRCYNLNGQLIDFSILNSWGAMHGSHVSYYDNGNMAIMESFYEGRNVGDYFEFYDNGKVSVYGQYANFVQDSLLPFYRDTLYENDSVHGMIGIISKGPQSWKINKWCYYNENGLLIKKEEYAEGKLLKNSK